MKRQLPKFFSSDGQIVLVILLVMAVILTIGLSIASRSVTDIKISQQTQEAARALWVAQAGLEKAIKANLGTAGEEMLGDISYNVSKTALVGGEEFVFPDKVGVGEIKTFWLVAHTENGEINESEIYSGNNLNVFWGETGNLSPTTPAIEVTCIYKNASGNFQNLRFAADPYQTRIPPLSNFSSSGGGEVLGKTFPFSAKIDLPSGTPFLLRIKFFYTETPVSLGLKSQGSGKAFPVQGNCFEAKAQVVESGIVRRLSECRGWQVTPLIFDYVLFSGGSM